jgi:biotin carboxyl carrier protein
MKFEVLLAGSSGTQRRIVELERSGDAWSVTLDGRRVDADIIAIDANVVSILLDGHSYTLQITPNSSGALKLQTALLEFTAAVADPRSWRGRHQGVLQAQGRQQVVAPMPGKVIRVLVSAGDHVEGGQGLVVVEAMKMQNEIRSPKGGVVERVLAREGQPVNAGEVLCIVS